jgi:excisionase family DNA binding protein
VRIEMAHHLSVPNHLYQPHEHAVLHVCAGKQRCIMPRAYTIAEFSETYKVGRTKIWQLIRDNQLKAVAVGSKKLIRADDAEAWFASLDANPNKHAA